MHIQKKRGIIQVKSSHCNKKNNENVFHLQFHETLACNICFDSGTCGQCHWFDGNYHGGYCDKHRADVDSWQSSCSDFWRE